MLILNTTGDTIKAEASAASSITVTAYGIEITTSAETYKKLGQVQLTGGGTKDTIYTVPASTIVVCSNIVIANTSASARAVSLWHVPSGGSAGDNNAIFKTVSINGNTTIVWNKGNIQVVPDPITSLAVIDGLSKADGNFIVADGSNWTAESGATARTSIGLGTGNSVEFTELTLSGLGTSEFVLTDGSKKLVSTLILNFGNSV